MEVTVPIRVWELGSAAWGLEWVVTAVAPALVAVLVVAPEVLVAPVVVVAGAAEIANRVILNELLGRVFGLGFLFESCFWLSGFYWIEYERRHRDRFGNCRVTVPRKKCAKLFQEARAWISRLPDPAK